MTTIKALNVTNLHALASSSAYTITGAGGELMDWVDGYIRKLNELEIGTPSLWFTFTGKDMNEAFSLSGNRAYKNDLTFLAFPLEGLDIGKLAMFKLRMGDAWFDDLVDNNSAR